MDTDSITQLILIIILLALSAFFSSAETAFTTVNHIRIRTLIDEGEQEGGHCVRHYCTFTEDVKCDSDWK